MTPISMDTIEKDTQSAHLTLGIRNREMMTITTAVIRMVWIACGKIAIYWSIKIKKGWKTVTCRSSVENLAHISLSSSTMFCSKTELEIL